MVLDARAASRWLRLASWLAFGFLYLPVAVLVIFSFSASRYSMVWGGFTLQWYAALADNARVLSALMNSLIVAGGTMLLSAVLGTAAALGLRRARFSGRGVLAALFYAPVVMPEIVLAIGLLMFFVLVMPVPLGLPSITLAHSVFGVAYVAIVVSARLEGFDAQLEEAAADLGATPWRVFLRVTLPLIWPGVLGGALLAFTLSFDDFVISYFVTGPGTATLPLVIYSMVKRGVTPEINALATLILLVSFAILALSIWLQSRNIAAGELGVRIGRAAASDRDPH